MCASSLVSLMEREACFVPSRRARLWRNVPCRTGDIRVIQCSCVIRIELKTYFPSLAVLLLGNLVLVWFWWRVSCLVYTVVVYSFYFVLSFGGGMFAAGVDCAYEFQFHDNPNVLE